MPLVQVIEWDEESVPEGGRTYAWKYVDPKNPERSDELGTWSQLVVRETQEAVLFSNGQALDLFGPGRHTLSTNNIPLLQRMIDLPFGGESPFKAEVWFVNKVHVLDVKWGTAEPIQLQDPTYGVFLPVRSYGQFGIRVEDSRKFLVKLVGTLQNIAQDDLVRFFRGLLMTKVRDLVSSYLVKKEISVVQVNAFLDEISAHMLERVAPTFGDFGIRVLNFFVNSINVPEDDPAVVELKKALAEKAKMDIMGYNYQQMRTFDALQAAASNEGGGGSGLLQAGVGLGVGLGVGGAFGGMAGTMAQQMQTGLDVVACPRCRASNPRGAQFCAACGVSLAEGPREESAICSACKSRMPQGAKFCPGCGAPLAACPKCGFRAPAGAKFCPECGSRLSSAGACPSCGKEVPPGTKFCPDCGGKIG